MNQLRILQVKSFSFFSVLGLMLFLTPNAFCQSEGFENVCDYGDNGQFFDGCFTDWISVSGRPSTTESGIEPFEGNQYATLTSYLKDCNGSTAFNQGGSSIAFSHDFNQGEKYFMSYAVSTNDNLVDARWVLTNDRVNQAGFDPGNCSNVEDWIPNESDSDQVVVMHSGNELEDNWRTFNMSFTPDTDFNQIWLKPFNRNPLSNVFQGPEILRLDDISVVPCNSLVPEVVFVDADGNPKSDFCYGEDIFVRVDNVDFWYNRVFFDIWDDIDNLTDYYGIGWIPRSANNIYNITQLVRDSGDGPIDPNGIFQLKIAIDHPTCRWIERFNEFSYECCDDINADLKCEILPEGNGISFEGSAVRDYTPNDGTHEICIYTDLDEDGVFELVLCTDNPTLITNLNQDTRYYITHTVTTPCGVFCENKDFCYGDCPQATPVEDCSTIGDPSCVPPTVSCPDDEEAGTELSWSDVGAQYYWIEIITNDPDCGCEGTRSSRAFLANRNFVSVNMPEEACYSYRVRSFCKGGGRSPWSPKRCMDDCDSQDDDDKQDHDPRQDDGKVGGPRSDGNIESKLSVYPSPFTDRLTVALEGLSSESVTLDIVSIHGKVVFRDKVKTDDQKLEYTWRKTASVPSGIYIIRVVDGKKVYTEKVMAQ